MKALGVDLGDKRVGIAVTQGALALPVCTLDRERKPADRLRRIARLGEQHGVDVFVLGLPLQMDGEEGAAAAKARDLGARLEARSGKPVHYIDERLTTVEAHKALTDAGVSGAGRTEVVDQVAAVLILESWLQRQAAAD